MQELEKYQFIYSNKDIYKTYGRTNHGKDSMKLVELVNPQSLLDVGCGYNDFCNLVKEKLKINTIGVDFACLGADIICDAQNLPFDNKSFDLLTAFDMLEHLLPNQVLICLKEFSRVSSNFIFSICYAPSRITCQGYNLHPTVNCEEWWIKQLYEAGAQEVNKYNNYIYGNW